jgi:hypothetical protein
MEIITLVIASISFVVVIVTTVVYAKKSIDMKKNLDYQIMDVKKNINDVTAENYRYDMKQQKDIDLTNTSISDVKTTYVKRADIDQKVTTETLDAKNVISGYTRFTNIGASFDNSFNNNPTMVLTEGSQFGFKGAKADFTVRSSGDIAADRNVVAGQSLTGKALDIQGSLPGKWGATIKSGAVMAEMVDPSGQGLLIKTNNQDPTKFGLSVENGTTKNFVIGNDGAQNLKYTSLTNPGWSMYGPKVNIMMGGADAGIVVNTNNTNPNASGLQIFNGTSVVMNAGNDGRVSVPGSFSAGSLAVNNANGTNTIFGENNVNTVSGDTTFANKLFVNNPDRTVSAGFATGDPINANILRGRTNVNNVLFTDDWSGYPDTAPGRGEISSDMGNFKALVIGGVKPSTTQPRQVRVLDDLTVSGKVNANSDVLIARTLDVADNTTLRGNLTARNIRHNGTTSTDRLDIVGTTANGSALFNGLLFDSSTGGLGIQSITQTASTGQKVPPGELRLQMRNSTANSPIFTKLNAAGDGKNYIEGSGTVFNTPVQVNQETTFGAPIVANNSATFTGLLSSTKGLDVGSFGVPLVSTSGGAYGIATSTNASTSETAINLYGPGSTVPNSSVNIGNMNADGTYSDAIKVKSDNSVTMSGKVNLKSTLDVLNRMTISDQDIKTSVPTTLNNVLAANTDKVTSSVPLVITDNISITGANADMLCLNSTCLTEADIQKIKALP